MQIQRKCKNILYKKKKNYLLGWLVWDVHPETTSTPEGEELLIHRQMTTGLVVCNAICNHLVPHTPYGCKFISFHTGTSSGKTVKPYGPLNKGEAPLAHDTPVEGTSLASRKHLFRLQVIILTRPCHNEDSKEGTQLHEAQVLEGGVTLSLIFVPQGENLVIGVDDDFC